MLHFIWVFIVCQCSRLGDSRIQRVNSYTMGCPPVRGGNPRALASGLSNVQVDKHGITFYTTYISVDLAHREIFRAKVGKGSISSCSLWLFCFLPESNIPY